MTDREKLAEILEIKDNTPTQSYLQEADILIANGVTVQKWIPVSERLPTKGKYLCCCDGYTNTKYLKICSFTDDLKAVDDYDFWDRKNVAGFFDYDSEYGYFECRNVTHWMPLPTAPTAVRI